MIEPLLALLENPQSFHEVGVLQFQENHSGVVDVAFDHFVFPLNRITGLSRLLAHDHTLLVDDPHPLPRDFPGGSMWIARSEARCYH
jgi:hypothetical protein